MAYASDGYSDGRMIVINPHSTLGKGRMRVSENQKLEGWTPRPLPPREVLAGCYVRLEPLDPVKHGDGLYAASSVEDAAERFLYLGDYPPASRDEFQAWLDKASQSKDPLFFALVEIATGRVGGRQAIMRIDPANGVAEIGSIYWGPGFGRTRLATEAFHLTASLIFDQLGYRRLEWKCNDRNEPSKRAALRFGFTYEGLFRQHMVVKGESRDTAWFSIIDSEWPLIRATNEAWLSAENFDREGQQRKSLQAIRSELAQND
ncbi:acetyltransferase GCN5 [Nitratireductor aestuarii]|uniref:Acetyltransferase GCN5 n=2 Tax=Nitratireductor aestuarii TaxID=1735103 RepID=A0A916RRB3_9HYPH|nr:acetyltransferase GCN5 [Nitratireductor aestuarii]